MSSAIGPISHFRLETDGSFRIAHARALPSPIWASLPSRDAETFRGHPSIPSSSQVAAEQMLRSRAVCLRSSFGFHGIHPYTSDFRAPWTRESCEFLVSTSERAENPPGGGEVRDSSRPHNLRLPERLLVGRWGLRRFRIASGQKSRTVCPRSAKRGPLPSERRGK